MVGCKALTPQISSLIGRQIRLDPNLVLLRRDLLALCLVCIILTVLGFDDADRPIMTTTATILSALLLETVRKLYLTQFQFHRSSFSDFFGYLLLRVIAHDLSIRIGACYVFVFTGMKIDFLDFRIRLLTNWRIQYAGSAVLLVHRVVQLDLVLRQCHFLCHVDLDVAHWRLLELRLLLSLILVRLRLLLVLKRLQLFLCWRRIYLLLPLVLDRRLVGQVEPVLMAHDHLLLETEGCLLIR